MKKEKTWRNQNDICYISSPKSSKVRGPISAAKILSREKSRRRKREEEIRKEREREKEKETPRQGLEGGKKECPFSRKWVSQPKATNRYEWY